MKIVFLGCQGSGKSTQARIIAQHLGLPYLEMGQLLRDKSKDGSKEAGEMQAAFQAGELISDQITKLVIDVRITNVDCSEGYILDGYPRNYAQLENLEKDIDRVFYIKISDEEAIKRLIARGREDDTFLAISRRVELFHEETEPLIAYFKQQNILEEIDGNQTIEEIANQIKSKI